MKKDRFILGATLLVLLIAIPMVFAEDTNIDSQTTKEVQTMITPLGAQVRMLQLEKSMTRNALIGATTLSVIKKNHPTADINAAQTTLDKLEILIDEVQNYPMTGDKNILVTEFVAVKKSAIKLTQEFREQTREILTAEDKQEIRTSIRNIDTNQLKGVNDEIKRAIREHNSARVEEMFALMGTNNPGLMQRIRDGNATILEVRRALQEAYQALTPEQKQELAPKIREQTMKKVITQRAYVDQAKKRLMERIREIETNKLNKVNQWLEQRGISDQNKGFEGLTQRLVNNIEQRVGRGR